MRLVIIETNKAGVKFAFATDPYTGEQFPLRGAALASWRELERVKRDLKDLVNAIELRQDKVIADEADRTRNNPKYKRTKKYG